LSGHAYIDDLLRTGWLGIVGGIIAVCLGMSGFCVLLWGGIL
jgi:hypothetical protein